jgi:hypothetical protein
VSVVAPTTDNRLTLTTCNPRYSASARLVVVSSLQSAVTEATPPQPPAGTPTSVETLGPDEPSTGSGSPAFGLGGQRGARIPALLWGLATLCVGVAAWMIARPRRRRLSRWAIYLAASPVMAVVMFLWFQQVNRLLPANI